MPLVKDVVSVCIKMKVVVFSVLAGIVNHCVEALGHVVCRVESHLGI